MTLKNIKSRGKGGVSVIPPYSFEYAGENLNYDNDAKDDWGYNDYASAWSLTKIITPIGESLDIVYEEDSFKQESAIANIVFDENFEMKFTGSDPGDKWVTFRNHHDNLQEQNINFNDYFVVGGESRVNVQYVWDPQGNGSERVADVDQICEVTDVNSTYVKFKLPSNSVGNYERSQGICNNDNWQYYNWYSDAGNQGSVVGRTANFVEEYRPNHCDEVTNGTHRTKIQFYSNKTLSNKIGGGLRVKDIVLNGEDGESYTTSYSYKDPSTGQTSGITSYEPSKLSKSVKYITEIPGPAVMYEYVTVSNKTSQNQTYLKDQYHFNVLKPMVETSGGFDIDGILSLSRTQNDLRSNLVVDGDDVSMKLSKFNLVDNLSSLGSLLSRKTYNSENQVISSLENEYSSNNEISQGITQETFRTYKSIISSYADRKYFLSSSSRTSYPNVIKKSTSHEGGITNSSQFISHDFLTSDVTETLTTSSDGRIYKSKSVPAYRKYLGMGSKADDSQNSNMLTQSAVNYSLLLDDGNWKAIGVGISTWNKDWMYTAYNGIDEGVITNPKEKIWRKHREYVWDGEIDSKGIYIGYSLSDDDNFKWNSINDNQPSPWKKVSEITKYDHYSRPLEQCDINQNFASTKVTGDSKNVILTANAKYGEVFYTGGEYDELPGSNYLDADVFGENFRTSTKAHTGTYSMKIPSTGNSISTAFGAAFRANKFRSGKYKLSLWAHKDGASKVRFKKGFNGDKEPLNGEKVTAGNWVQMNHYFDLSEGETQYDRVVLITSEVGDVFVDDLRIHPVSSTMSTYVYNDWNELSFVLGANNLGTGYLYDQSGRLVKVKEEVVNQSGLIGGFKTTNEYSYNYKIPQEGCSPELVSFTDSYQCNNIGASFAKLNAPIGTTINFEVTTTESSGNNGGTNFATLYIDGVQTTTGSYTLTGSNPQPIFKLLHSGTDTNGFATIKINSVEDNCLAIVGNSNRIDDLSLDQYQLCDPNPYGNQAYVFISSLTENITGSAPNCFISYSGNVMNVPSGGNYEYQWAYRLLEGNDIVFQSDFTISNSSSYTTDVFTICDVCTICDNRIQLVCLVTDLDTSEVYVGESGSVNVNCSCQPH